MITTVSTVAQLVDALGMARAGDKILLSPGTYSDVGLNGLQADGTVTVRSADLDHPAVLTGLGIRNSSGFRFEHIEVNAVPGFSEKTGVIGIDNSSRISFDHLYVHGTLNGDPSDDQHGMRIKASRDITVTNSEFRELFQAVSFAGSSNVKISGNLVHQIRQDGIRGYDTSNLTISDNYLTDFYKVGSEHADAIQIYTGSYGPAHHIRVVGNVITQGDGAEVQGIFIRDDSASLRNVEVSGNLVVGATLNGIALSGVNGLKVDANTVISRTGELSWLSVKTSPEAVVTNNEALRFILNGDMVENNNNLNITTGYDEAVVQAWLGSSTTANSFLDRLSDVPKTSGATAVTSAVSRTLLGSEEDLSLKGVANADGGGNGLDNALVGNSGNNRLFGAGGDDVIEGGAGDDVLDGGAGVDTASYEHAKGSVTVNLLKGFSKTYGAGQDTYRGVENVTGSAYSDTLSGDAGKNVLAGGGGSDRLIGNGGADTMTGGAGADMFFYNALNDSKATARDTILDFNRAAGDTIHLRNIDANANRPGDQAFTLVHGFTKVAGQLTVTLEVDHYAVRGDVNGDAIADFAINVHTGKSLLASDFVL